MRREFERRGHRHALRLFAHTGVAANNIGGETYCARLGFATFFPTMSAERIKRLADDFEGVTTIVIDEFTLTGARSLFRIDQRLRDATGVQRAFGGLKLVLVGDPAQLPAVKDYALFTVRRDETNDSSLVSMADCEDGYAGQELYRLFDNVVCLRESMRHADDALLDRILAEIRDFALSDESIERLVRVNADVTERTFERQRPGCMTLCATNAARSAVNARCLDELRRAGNRVFRAKSSDSCGPNARRVERPADVMGIPITVITLHPVSFSTL